MSEEVSDTLTSQEFLTMKVIALSLGYFIFAGTTTIERVRAPFYRRVAEGLASTPSPGYAEWFNAKAAPTVQRTLLRVDRDSDGRTV